MPREGVHWAVLNEAISRLRASAPSILTAQTGAALLGAILHDVPYYSRGKFGDFERVGTALHGLQGEDTFEPIRRLLRAVPAGAGMHSARAVVLGMVSHIVTDVIFHPAIFYFTGDYYHADSRERHLARYRHRAIEVYLDHWISERRASTGAYWIDGLADAVSDLSQILDLFAGHLLPDREISTELQARAWRGSLATMARAQRYFENPLFGAALRVARYCGSWQALEIDGLCSFCRYGQESLFDERFHYRNPVSGEWCEDSWSDLFDRAVAETARLFQKMGEECSAHALDHECGRSLNYGVCGAGPEEGRYFLAYPPHGLAPS